jgi:hypothetical protein
MKYLLPVAVIAALVITAAPFSQAQLGQGRPADIPAESWIQMGPAAGFVVTNDAASPKIRPNDVAVNGYFMGKVNGIWVRLEPSRLGGIVPAS